MPATVLITEDDEDTRAIYRGALSERGYRVLETSQGARGVHLARTYRPALILLDIRMPVMDGWGAIRYLRSYPETRSIPVVAISAYEPDREKLEQVGNSAFDGFLVKPSRPAEVVAEVEARIGPPLGGLPGSSLPPPQ